MNALSSLDLDRVYITESGIRLRRLSEYEAVLGDNVTFDFCPKPAPKIPEKPESPEFLAESNVGLESSGEAAVSYKTATEAPFAPHPHMASGTPSGIPAVDAVVNANGNIGRFIVLAGQEVALCNSISSHFYSSWSLLKLWPLLGENIEKVALFFRP